MILVIDDDKNLAGGLEKLFRYAGLESVAVSNALEALSLLPVRKPKLIVLDLDMPTMDGLTLLRAIRQDADFKSVPIVIHSSDFSELSQARAFDAGAQDYLVKGAIGWQALLARVRSLIAEPETRVRYVQ